jgi:signal transduction histidine kinase
MTAFEVPAGESERPAGRGGRAATLASLALLAGLAAALSPQLPTGLAVLLAAGGGAALVAVCAPPVVVAVRSHLELLWVVALVALGAIWIETGLRHAAHPWPALFTRLPPNGYPGLPYGPPVYGLSLYGAAGWPWRLGDVALLPVALTLLAAAGGFVLIADAVRVQLGLAGPPRAPWRVITTPRERGGRIAWRAVPGVALIGVAAVLAISATTGAALGDPVMESVLQLAIGACAAALVAAPVAVGVAMQLDLDKAGRAREQERQRFAAHLHDSVLQTLALVQRQAHDPAAVIRLARRQEHALRAWMAGEAELVSDTVTAALREIAGEIEDEHATTVELTAIGDHALDQRGEALVAAAREALRNAATHAPGTPVLVFSDITAARAEMFIRDRGPGFDFDAVPAERRGLRDAVIGRMAAVGGSATVESSPGQGTEVTLRLPYNGRSR